MTCTDPAELGAALASTWSDTVVVSRPGVGVDAEANPTATLTVVATVTGQIVVPPPSSGAADPIRLAGQAGQTLQRRLLVPSGTSIAPGDVVDARSARWRVMTVEDVTLYIRAVIERTEH